MATKGEYWKQKNQVKQNEEKEKKRMRTKVDGKKPLDAFVDKIKSKDKTGKLDKKDVIEDVLDENFDAEVDPDAIPASKTGVLNKKKKGVDKLKKFVGKK